MKVEVVELGKRDRDRDRETDRDSERQARKAALNLLNLQLNRTVQASPP